MTSLNALHATDSISPKRLWTGRVLTGWVGLFLLFDSAMKLLLAAPAIKATIELGYPQSSIIPIGVVLLASVVLYLVPRTSVFGALLLTGYLGGAIATHVRVGNPLFSHILFPVYVAIMLWAGLVLRDRRLEAILFSRRA